MLLHELKAGRMEHPAYGAASDTEPPRTKPSRGSTAAIRSASRRSPSTKRTCGERRACSALYSAVGGSSSVTMLRHSAQPETPPSAPECTTLARDLLPTRLMRRLLASGRGAHGGCGGTVSTGHVGADTTRPTIPELGAAPPAVPHARNHRNQPGDTTSSAHRRSLARSRLSAGQGGHHAAPALSTRTQAHPTGSPQERTSEPRLPPG